MKVIGQTAVIVRILTRMPTEGENPANVPHYTVGVALDPEAGQQMLNMHQRGTGAPRELYDLEEVELFTKHAHYLSSPEGPPPPARRSA